MNTMELQFNQAEFLKSAFKRADLPPDFNIEIAFAGRSNVGKSSVINLLTQQKKLAKTSKTPGRTQSINFFTVTGNVFLIDLPGYGYAKVSQETKAHWQTFLKGYILERKSLKGVMLIMDCRHPFTPLDQQFFSLTNQVNCPCHILLNKADKLSNNEKSKIKQTLLTKILPEHAHITWQFFSALRGEGLDEMKKKFREWVEHDELM
ncbi:MAG: ribosome biogenesis GTP-binding protein YihA/YsxC [Gammaproteobacteria bacterium]|nr:ribosome biogenesis GTP-binding protein YihA/YsxC [Gammaproteobacteria bacterium]